MLPRSLYMKYYLLTAIIIILDQMTKLMIRTYMYVGESIPIIEDFFHITYVKNYGAAFSMLSGERVLLVAIPIVVVVGTLWYFHHHRDKHWTFYTAWSMIIAGGIGNLIDRIYFGWVTDMLDFSIFPPVFNVADIGVTLGCALFIFYTIAEEKLQNHDGKRTEI